MRAVVQRVTSASVEVGGAVVGSIDRGLLVLLGVGRGDADSDADWMAEKVANLRVFEDDAGKMNRSLLDGPRALLAVSQFTLYGDARKGRRPSFVEACEPVEAKRLYERLGYSVIGDKILHWSYTQPDGEPKQVEDHVWILRKMLENR